MLNSVVQGPLPIAGKAHTKRPKSYLGKSRLELEPSIRTHLLPSPRLVWWLPGTRQFTDACPALVGMRDSGSSGFRPGRLLGDSNPSAFEPSPSFSHQLCENRSPLSFLATDGPWSQLRGCPLTSRSQSSSGRSRGSTEPAEPMPTARRHGLGIPALLRSQISGSLAPTDFTQQPLRVAWAPGMARSQAAARAESIPLLPRHLPRLLCSPLAPHRRRCSDHPDSPPAPRRHRVCALQAEPGRPPSRGRLWCSPPTRKPRPGSGQPLRARSVWAVGLTSGTR